VSHLALLLLEARGRIAGKVVLPQWNTDKTLLTPEIPEHNGLGDIYETEALKERRRQSYTPQKL